MLSSIESYFFRISFANILIRNIFFYHRVFFFLHSSSYRLVLETLLWTPLLIISRKKKWNCCIICVCKVFNKSECLILVYATSNNFDNTWLHRVTLIFEWITSVPLIAPCTEKSRKFWRCPICKKILKNGIFSLLYSKVNLISEKWFHYDFSYRLNDHSLFLSIFIKQFNWIELILATVLEFLLKMSLYRYNKIMSETRSLWWIGKNTSNK